MPSATFPEAHAVTREPREDARFDASRIEPPHHHVCTATRRGLPKKRTTHVGPSFRRLNAWFAAAFSLFSAVNAAHASPCINLVGAAQSGPPEITPATWSTVAASPESGSDWRIAVRIVPPLGRWGAGAFSERDSAVSGMMKFPVAIGLGGLAIGAIAPNGVWMEGSASALQGLEGVGWETTVRAGYELGPSATPDAWGFSVPIYLGYRYARLPYYTTTDSSFVTEDMSLLVTGARLVLIRSFRRNAIEFGLDLSGSIPIARSEQPRGFSVETTFWVDAAIVVGWSTRL